MNGVRIELEGTNSHFPDHPQVEKSQVMVINNILVGFIKASKCTTEELKKYMLDILPTNMMPRLLIKVLVTLFYIM